MPLAGRPMVEWSIEAFRRAGVAAIVVAVPPGHDYEPAAYEPHGSDAPQAPPSIRVLAGGETRSASVSNALAVVETELVAIHDAARPLLTAGADRGRRRDADGRPRGGGRDRRRPGHRHDQAGEPCGAVRVLRRRQTDARRRRDPRSGRALGGADAAGLPGRGAARRAGRRSATVAAATDEAMLVEAAGGRVLIHPAEAENLKVTTALDLRLAEQLLARALLVAQQDPDQGRGEAELADAEGDAEADRAEGGGDRRAEREGAEQDRELAAITASARRAGPGRPAAIRESSPRWRRRRRS